MMDANLGHQHQAAMFRKLKRGNPDVGVDDDDHPLDRTRAILRRYAGDNLLGVYPSGSFMKGTAVLSGTDIDLFLSLSEHTNETLKEVYNKLFDCLTSAGYSPRRQNVSLNITVSKYSVDLVPGKRQNALS